ncbi:MAG: type IX secretion system plug protein domain-containing protein, partial [Sphingobacteriaceae bacterium]
MRFNVYKLFLFFGLILGTTKLLAQTEEDYVNDNTLRYDDHAYKSYIKTVQLHGTEWEFSPPLIEMNSGNQLELSFDDLEGDQKQYSLTFVHCNADWTPSDLMTMEYMDGFFDLNIINFNFSINTLQKYTHYSMVFPTSTVKFIKSGNYIVYV